MQSARKLLLWTLLWALQAPPLVAQAYYAILDLGAKGAKIQLYEVSDGKEIEVRQLFANNISTSLASSMAGKRLTAAGIREAADATHSLVSQAKQVADAKGYAGVRYIVIGSSAVADSDNKEALVDAVRDATGLTMSFISARHEAYYGLLGAVPSDRWRDALYVDVGSGNTRLGCLVEGSDLSSFKFAEIAFGSVTGRSEALKRNPRDLEAGIKSFIAEEVRPSYLRQSMDAPCLRNRESIFWTGGAAWSVVTIMHPEKSIYSPVPLTRQEISAFLALLVKGTWSQVKPRFAFPAGISKQEIAKIKAAAEKDRHHLLDTFVAEDMVAGISIMEAILASANRSAEIDFVRNESYTREFVKEKFREDRALATQHPAVR